jgi:restriction endonuclease S subunit
MTGAFPSINGLRPNTDWEKLPLFERTGWRTLPFGEFAQSINERVEPSDAAKDIYVGLEHLDPQSLHIRRWGKGSDVIGTKLRFRKGDIIFGRRRAYQRKLAVTEFNGICSAHAMVTRAKPDTVLPECLPFLMMSDKFMNRAVEISVGSLSPTINWKTLKLEEFALPTLDQQCRIAEILWMMDEVNQTSDLFLDSVVKSRAAITATMTDATAFSNWPSVPLVESFDIVSGQVDPREETYRSMFLVAPNHIEQGSGRILETQTVAQQNAISGKYLFQSGDVVYSKIRPNLQKCFIAEFHGLCSADMYPLRPKEEIIKARYLLALLLGEHFTSFAVSRCVRTGIPKINRVELGEYIAPIPKLDVQEKICAKLEEIDSVFSAGLEYRRGRLSMLSGMLTAFFGGAS